MSFSMLIILFVCAAAGCVVADFGLTQTDLVEQLKVPQCREQCLDKTNTDDLTCLQQTECSMCDFPSYNFNKFAEIHELLCWNSCSTSTSSTSTKVNKPQLDIIKLKILSMVRDGSLTSADIAWKSISKPSQCLVTWEISGGGLMGNLLTDTDEVQLSLWPDSKYRVQVTCKNNISGKMFKSLPLLVDTSKITADSTVPTTTATATKSTETITTISESLSTKSTLSSMDTTIKSTNSLPTTNIPTLLKKIKLPTITSKSHSPSLTLSSSSSIKPITSNNVNPPNDDNIRVVLTRHQNAAATGSRTWKNQIIKMEATLAIFVSLLLFLVICSIFSVKRRQPSECDKVKLIGSDSEVDLVQTTQTLHV